MRAIDADALIECLQTWKTVAVSEGLPINERFATAMIAQVNLMPTIESQSGKWIRNDNGTWSCDQCNSWIPDEQHRYARFCLYCGAKMETDNDDIPIEYFESGGK